jgi:hypothetical protein
MHFPSDEEDEEERHARTMLNNKSAAIHDPASLSNKSGRKNVLVFFMCVRSLRCFKSTYLLYSHLA